LLLGPLDSPHLQRQLPLLQRILAFALLVERQSLEIKRQVGLETDAVDPDGCSVFFLLARRFAHQVSCFYPVLPVEGLEPVAEQLLRLLKVGRQSRAGEESCGQHGDDGRDSRADRLNLFAVSRI